MSTYPSLAPFILKRPWLTKMLTPLASWYTNAAGYRKLGLRADDLICEEDENVIKALKRLPPREAYDRVYRLRRAFQCSATHKLLPKEEWTKEKDDVPYLQPLIDQIHAEEKEKIALDSMTVIRSH
ncbi:14 kDa subunit of cytochrome bd ubiquinol oxidase [Rostrohypoxylon terebratum]|nr:14 kDa subunit of cytochrome bd ubiquinol oxidase [Rostrohypoxylon terebratum]